MLRANGIANEVPECNKTRFERYRAIHRSKKANGLYDCRQIIADQHGSIALKGDTTVQDWGD
jgi:hypothetical protein